MSDDQIQTALDGETVAVLTVTTDSFDYAPGTIATFTALNVVMGGAVTFSVAHVDPGPDGIVGTADDGLTHDLSGTTSPWSVTDGGLGDLDGIANGVIVTSWSVNQDALNQAFLLTATDDSGATATATFTDAVPPLPSAPNGIDATVAGNYTANELLIYTFDAPNLPVGVPSTTGTGTFAPFLQIKANTTEQGYNTGGATEFDTKDLGSHTHSIQLNSIPITSVNGVAYRVFLLDLNEQGGNGAYISLDLLKIYTSSVATLTGYNDASSSFSSGSSTLRYNLDGGPDGNLTIGLTNGHSGSGNGDYAFLVPYADLPNDPTNPYVYVYAKLGHEGSLNSGWDSDSGFEEIGVRAVAADTAALAIDKVTTGVDGDGVTHTGDGIVIKVGNQVTWTYTVTNQGNVALSNVVVSDDKQGTLLSHTGDINNNSQLDIGEVWVYTATGTAAGGFYSNVGTASATGAPNATDRSSYTGFVPLIAGLTIDKIADKSVVDAAGQVIHYTIAVANTGNVDLTNVVLTDTFAGGATLDSGDTDHDLVLDVGETWVYKADYTVQQSDLNAGDDLVNLAVVATDQTGPQDDDATTRVEQNADFTIVKSAALADGGTAADETSDVIDYTIVLTNTGNVTLTGVTLDDTLLDGGLSAPVESISANNQLDVGETWTYTGSHGVTQAELDAGGSIDNTATGDTGQTGEKNDSASEPVEQKPSIHIVKVTTGSDGTTSHIGDNITVIASSPVTWTYTVTNDGNVDLTNVEVTDDQGAIPVYLSGDTGNDKILGVDETLDLHSRRHRRARWQLYQHRHRDWLY